MATSAERAFPALLRYWRHQRGLSQLDLALSAGVSVRHVSFLETGRSRPSVEMVMLLVETLDVPLRSRNEVLRAAGFPARYPEPGIEAILNGPLAVTIGLMLAHHEPFPLVVVDRWYTVATANRAAARLFELVGTGGERNVARLLFQPALRAIIEDWPRTASSVLRRLQRETLHHPDDETTAALLAELLDQPDVPEHWRQPDLTAESEPALPLRLRIGDASMAFMMTITAFQAPSNVTLDELRFETFFPLDAPTAELCRALLG